ncbi:MAG: HD-GYP domain-containing protein [Bacillota bacterium]
MLQMLEQNNYQTNEERKIQEILDFIPESLVVLNKAGAIKYTNLSWNQAAEENCLDRYWRGRGIDYLGVLEKSVQNGSETAQMAANGIKAVLNREKQEYHLNYTCDHGEIKKWFEMKVRPFQEGIIISHVDITAYQEKINYLNNYDSLTGIFNRAEIEEQIKKLDTWNKLPFSVIMVDVNGLRRVNEDHNNKRGDLILIITARLLEEVSENKYIVGRWGEDEFILLMPNASRNTAEKLNSEIKRKAEEYSDLSLSLSTGVAVKKHFQEKIGQVISKATENLYWDKRLNSSSGEYKVIQGLLSILSDKSDETREHSQRMQELAVRFGDKIGLDNEEINKLKMLAYLHDIGKVNISKEILTKSDELSEEEWQMIRQHPQLGYDIVSSIAEYAPVAELILSHHERWDGNGYPRGLQGEEIPYLSRIISLIDSYDVMTHARNYKQPINQVQAMAEISRGAGSQFDPVLADKFLELLSE